MASQGEDVYATLLLNDFYLPGALVLAHSLKDAGTTKKLAVLVTADTISADAMAELQKIFDFIIPVARVDNDNPANLYLMDRADLQSTFTKITLWQQTQFRKIVYVDADMVALRAPDELFDLPQPFSAAPDIGWPDIFNTGLMALTPNMGDYWALLAMAKRGISFDGADQGLLNMHFKNSFSRLSFTYNVTPSAHYQYLPAYRHFQSAISMAHFIGQSKPWNQGRDVYGGSTPYDEMVGRWWAVYDRHFRESSVDSTAHGNASIIQYHTKGEFQPVTPIVSTQESGGESFYRSTGESSHETIEIPQEREEAYIPPIETDAEGSQNEKETQYAAWDASRAPPPADSQPEAHNFPATHYEFASDPTPFKAPERYPSPPKDMYYEVPKTPTYQKPTPIFPWEKHASKPSRVFAEDNLQTTTTAIETTGNDTAVGSTDTPVTPTTPTISLTPADAWQTYTRGNAWDEIPEIERYIGNLQKNRKGNIQVLQGYGSGIEQVSSPGGNRQSMKLTDFPTELERPSLPVTPAPIRRPTFWGEERDDEGELPGAEGVPSQEQWDPSAQLEALARRQSDVIANKLSMSGTKRDIPMRPLPYGSEGVTSPTYVLQGPKSGGTKTSETTVQTSSDSTAQSTLESTSSKVDRDNGFGLFDDEETTTASEETTIIQEASYNGPSAAWERGVTFATFETQMPPSEEERDVLDN